MKSIGFYVFRIILTFSFLFFSIFLWNDASALKIDSSLASGKVYLIELSDGINLADAYPVSDEKGSRGEGYSFKVVNNEVTSSEFSVKFISTLSDEYEALDNKFIRYQVIKNGKIFINALNICEDGVLFKDKVEKENTYELKLWIDKNATNEAMGKFFSSKIALI